MLGTLAVLWASERFFHERKSHGSFEASYRLVLLFLSGDLVNKIPTCSVAVISNSSVCNVCVFHTTVFSVIQWFAVLWFLV